MKDFLKEKFYSKLERRCYIFFVGYYFLGFQKDITYFFSIKRIVKHIKGFSFLKRLTVGSALFAEPG